MDIHNYPVDSHRPDPERAGRSHGSWALVCGLLLAAPLIVGGTWFLLAWLVFPA
jgi:hypothetical protein